MAHESHTNMFDGNDDPDYVYYAFDDNFNKYLKRARYWECAGVAFFVLSAYLGLNSGYPYFLLGLYSLFNSQTYTADLSNLNYFMHGLDWKAKAKKGKFLGPHFMRDSMVASGLIKR